MLDEPTRAGRISPGRAAATIVPAKRYLLKTSKKP